VADQAPDRVSEAVLLRCGNSLHKFRVFSGGKGARMLANNNSEREVAHLDDQDVGEIADALRAKFGHRAALYAVKQIGVASDASMATWLAVYRRLVAPDSAGDQTLARG